MPASLSVNPAEMLPADDVEHSLRGPKWLRRENLRIHAPEVE